MDIPRKFIKTTDVDAAREALINYIKNMVDQRVIYYNGWSELGASAVLRSMAQVLPLRRHIPELCFDRIIFIDCSEWKSRRSMQRKIAEKLKLDCSTMAILDKQDEEDDFHGIDESSRAEIISVSGKINNILKDGRFLMLFCNGSDHEIDLYGSGVPPFGKFAHNILIWTWRRSLLTIKERDNRLLYKLRFTHVFYYDDRRYTLTGETFYKLLCQEAAIIAAGITPTMVADCCLYKLFLHDSFCTTTKYDWASHATNCWICDGILEEDIEREISDMLHRKISLDCDASALHDVITMFKKHLKISFLRVKDGDIYEEGPYRWISVTSKDTKLHGIKNIPAQTSSFILEFDISEPPLALTNCLFEHSNILGVLILCCCAFNFASPPFVKCSSLKFLGLDQCTDSNQSEIRDHTEWACLYRLSVLDLRSTYWTEILSQEKIDLMANIRELNIEGFMCWQYTTRLQGRLPNLERLRIIKPTCEPEISTDTSNSFLGKTKLEILDLSGNSDMEILPTSLTEVSSLQVLVLDGCTKLQDIVPNVLPRLLRSFRLDGYVPPTRLKPDVDEIHPIKEIDKKGANNISKISLKGFTQLDNLFLRGLANLVELDLSESAIKVLDFETMVVEVPRIKRLFLLGCEHLRAIRWGGVGTQADLELLCIDTRAGTACPWPSLSQNKPLKLQVHAVVEDARLVWSLCPPISRPIWAKAVHFDIHVTSSPVYKTSGQLKAVCEEKTVMYSDQVCSVPASKYIDVLSMVSDAQMQAFPEPPTTNLVRHIEIAQGSCGLESALDGGDGDDGDFVPHNLAYIMKLFAESLHVHNVSARHGIIIPVGELKKLKQCHVESCPNLYTVFPSRSDGFSELETFWALDLPMARQILGRGYRYKTILSKFEFSPWAKYATSLIRSFQNLRYLHLSSCPRLEFVLPVWFPSFPRLETLHIRHCGVLKHIFVLDGEYPQEIVTKGVAFPKLTAIHLHDLATLRQICEVNMVAPMLESIKIRGCFGMRRLPVVDDRGPGVKKPTVEIEKNVWDALEWDGAEAGHHPSHFEAPVHSRHYRKKLPRTSVLR